MMKHVSFALLLGIATPSFAIDTTQQLLAICEEGEQGNAFKAGQCLGYIDGVVSSLNTRWGNLRTPDQSPSWFCASPGVTFGQMRAIFTKHAKDNPKLWNQPADLHVGLSLVLASSCPKQ
jgi:hypothetical protein